MEAVVVSGYPDNGSGKNLNDSILEKITEKLVKNGYQVNIHNLYSDKFDPVLSECDIKRKYSTEENVLKYQKEVEKSEILIIIYPEWWGTYPAVLKGYIDRIFSPGFAYDYTGEDFGKKTLSTLLDGRKLHVICTAAENKNYRLHKILWEEVFSSQTGIKCENIFYLGGLKDKSVTETDNELKIYLDSIVL